MSLSCALNRSNIGGRIGGEIVNHLSYADDLCLICLSSAGMQKLLNVCSNYATEHSLSYNANKPYSLCCNPIRSGGGFKSPPLSFFALTHLILELHYCALGTFP